MVIPLKLLSGVAALAVLVGGCKTYTFNRDNRPCDATGRCADGYQCSPLSNRCLTDAEAAAELAANQPPLDDGSVPGAGSTGATGGSAATGSTGATASTGPSCTPTTEIPCNGIDEDCSGADAVDANNCQPVTDADGDGVDDDDDSAPNDPTRCRDSDSDGCDDCSSGSFAPANDGIDRNGNGQCNVTDRDEDGDGVEHPSDSDDDDDAHCQDLDRDGCDDCKYAPFTGYPNVYDDGEVDNDGDGICADAVVDGAANPRRDCDDTVPMCGSSRLADNGGPTPSCVTDVPADPASEPGNASALMRECVKRYCVANASDPNGDRFGETICTRLRSKDDWDQAINELPSGGMAQTVYLLADVNNTADAPLDRKLLLSGPAAGEAKHRIILHGRIGVAVHVDLETDETLLTIAKDNGGNELHGLSFVAKRVGDDARVGTVLHVRSGGNLITDNHFIGYHAHAIALTADGNTPAQNKLRRNFIVGGTRTRTGPPNAPVIDGTASAVELVGQTEPELLANIIGVDQHPAVTLRAATRPRLIHNTLFAAGSLPSALVHVRGDLGSATTDACARNNLLFSTGPADARNGLTLVRFSEPANTSWSTASGCATLGNVHSATNGSLCGVDAMAVPLCGGAVCSACLAPSFYSDRQLTPDPATAFEALPNLVTPSADDFNDLCLVPNVDTPSADLIDTLAFTAPAGTDVDGPYVNVGYVGNSLEPGALQHRTPACGWRAP